MTRARKSTSDATLFVVPAVLLLALVFVAPLIWFFARTLAEIGSPAEMLSYAWQVLSSKAVVTALTTTNWIALLVTLLVLVISYPLAFYLATSRGFGFTIVLKRASQPYIVAPPDDDA